MLSIDIRAIAPTRIRAHPHAHRAAHHDYSRNPMLVYWEMTQACPLACRHCRAEAVSTAHPEELTHAESLELLQPDRRLRHQAAPHPHRRRSAAARRHLRHHRRGPPPRPHRLHHSRRHRRAHRRGLRQAQGRTASTRIGLSLDGSSAARHEAIRGVAGCFDWTIDAIRNAAELGFPIQVNTLVSEETADDLPAIYELLKGYKIMRWSLFYLIAVGRGKELQPVTPERGEELMHWTHELDPETRPSPSRPPRRPPTAASR